MSPHWLFFPTQASPPQYIYNVVTDQVVTRGTVQLCCQKQEATGTESGDLADQFAPFFSNTQFSKNSASEIQFRTINSDTSSSDYGSVTALNNNITAMSLTVGSNTINADTISVTSTDAKPVFRLQTSDSSAGTFWDNNCIGNDINMIVTLTF